MPDGKRSEEWKRQVGQRLRAVRTAAGYRTAREFAEKLDIEENTLTSWERGERLIEPEGLAGVRELTGVTADYILLRRSLRAATGVGSELGNGVVAGSRATLPHLNIGEDPEFSNPANFVRDPHSHSGGALRPSPGSTALRLWSATLSRLLFPPLGRAASPCSGGAFFVHLDARGDADGACRAFSTWKRQKEKIQGGPATSKQVVIRWVTLLATPYAVVAFAQIKPLREVLPFVWVHHELSHPREILSIVRDGDLAFDPFAYVFGAGFPDHRRFCVRK